LTLTVSATDPDGDPVQFTASPLPSNAVFTPATGTLSFSPDFTQAGDYSITITGSDGILTATRTIPITVPNVNQPPVLAPLVNLVVNETEIVNLALLASDPDGTASLSLGVENLPPFAEFTDLGSGQGTIRFTPGFADAGSYLGIAVTVADHDPSNPLTDTKTFDVTVHNTNRPPNLPPIANQSLAEGATLDVAIGATDPDGSGTLRLTLENAPAFVALTDQGSGQGILHLTPGYLEAGAYTGIAVRVSDQDPVAPLDAVQTFTVTVGNTNRAPQVTPIPNQTVAEGSILDLPVTATDPDGVSSLTLGLAGAPTFVTLTDQGGGQGVLHIAPGPGTAATYLNVTVIAADHDGVTPLEGQAAFTLTVTQAASPSFTAYLHGSESSANPPILFLDDIAPTAATEKYKDSDGVNFNNGNPWAPIGTWTSQPMLTPGTLSALRDLQTWVGVKNSDDIGTQFDLRAEVFKNGTLVASGVARCLTGITRNPDLAKEVAVAFDPFPAVEFDGATDTLSLTLLTRIGTNPDDTKCAGPGGSHNNARGLRLYFDAATRASQFGAVAP
jgi:hypothetical protein